MIHGLGGFVEHFVNVFREKNRCSIMHLFSKVLTSVFIAAMAILLFSLDSLKAFAFDTNDDTQSVRDSSNITLVSTDYTTLEDVYAYVKRQAQEQTGCAPDPLSIRNIDPLSLRSRSPYWESSSFYNGDGSLYLKHAMRVVDVSEWQGAIDWEKVRASGVDAAIIRIGYGEGNEDDYAARNIAECERLDIPYGLYLYSYAYDSATARDEAVWTASLMAHFQAKPELPIYYDLEEWTWAGHEPPSDVSTYESIVRTYVDTLRSYDIGNVSIYSYTSYLQGPLNSQYIWSMASWVAQYNSHLTFENPYEPDFHGWQYTSSARVSGIETNVDMSAFVPLYPPETADPGWQNIGGRQYYYDASGNLVRGWLDLGGERYRLDRDAGFLWTGWYTVDGVWYYSDPDGSVRRID